MEGDLITGLEYGSEYDTGIGISSDIYRRSFKKTLNLVSKEYILGVGCRKNTSSDKLEEMLNNILKRQNISVQQIRNVSYIDIKSRKEAILKYCKAVGIKFMTYSDEERLKVEGEFTS